MLHLIPLEQIIMPFQNFCSGSLDPTVTADLLHGLLKRSNNENLNSVLAWSKCIQSKLKGIILGLIKNWIWSTYPMSCFKTKMVVFEKNCNFLLHLGVVGYVKPFKLNVLSVPFRLIGIHFDHLKKIRFSILVLPFP